MNNISFSLNLFEIVLNIGIILFLFFIFRNRQKFSKIKSDDSQFRLFKGRNSFNDIGIEIVNGSVAKDKIYAIFRTGTVSEPFIDTIEKHRSLDDTSLIIITPNSETFLSNCNKNLLELTNSLYENPNCDGMRGLLLEPDLISEHEKRMRGYLFISNGHVHKNDEGFYSNSIDSSKFIQSYFKSLILSGNKISV